MCSKLGQGLSLNNLESEQTAASAYLYPKGNFNREMMMNHDSKSIKVRGMSTGAMGM